MKALLGKITELKQNEDSPGTTQVSFKPACVLPDRDAPPEWLKDQTLKTDRSVPDPREIGRPGDSIVLTPRESLTWLNPLNVEPAVVYGDIPQSLRLQLRWWKDDKGPDYTVHANGRRLNGKFEKDGDFFRADIDTAPFFDSPPKLPVTLEVSCDKLTASCTVLPRDVPYSRKIQRPGVEAHRMENEWYAVDLVTTSHCGAVCGLLEKGRGLDHFRQPDDLVLHPMEWGGAIDRVGRNWSWLNSMNSTAMTCAGASRAADSTQVTLEGVIEEGRAVRTSVVYTLYDAFPLLTWKRGYHIQPEKKKEEDKGKPEKPKETVDELETVALGFRAAWMAERDDPSGSRFLCEDNGSLKIVRCARLLPLWEDILWEDTWRMTGGWAVAEHPGRREYSLCLFDPAARLTMTTWWGDRAVALEPIWPRRAAKPADSLAITLGVAVGELCGAGDEGAWVACRIPSDDGVRCAVVGRFREPSADAVFTVGGETRAIPLEKMLAPGLGCVHLATVEMAGAMSDRFDVTAGGIESRSTQ